MHTNKSFILSVPEAVQISSTSVLGWHQDILTIVQTLGILTFCYILCLVISDPRYVCCVCSELGVLEYLPRNYAKNSGS